MTCNCQLQARKLVPWYRKQDSAFAPQQGTRQSPELAPSFISKHQSNSATILLFWGINKSYLQDRADVPRPDAIQSLLPKPEEVIWGEAWSTGGERSHPLFLCQVPLGCPSHLVAPRWEFVCSWLQPTMRNKNIPSTTPFLSWTVSPVKKLYKGRQNWGSNSWRRERNMVFQGKRILFSCISEWWEREENLKNIYLEWQQKSYYLVH